MVNEMTRLKLPLAFVLAFAGCAAVAETDSDRASELEVNALQAAEGLEATSDGVTDVESALEAASGGTDEPGAWVGAAAAAAQKPTCTQTGAIACSPRSTGTGVSHGSPQPIDPSPAAARDIDPRR